MTLAEDAHVEAEKRWPIDRDWSDEENEMQLAYQEGFERGAQWQAANRPITNALVNRLLFTYDHDPNFGVREFREALEAEIGARP